MKRIRVAIAVGIFALAGAGARAEPLTSMDAVGAALQACWKAPDTKGAVTLSFSIKRDGSLIGPPRAMAIAVDGDDDAKKAFVDAAIAAVEACTPLDLAPDLAAGIAGSVYSMQFSSPPSASAPVSN